MVGSRVAPEQACHHVSGAGESSTVPHLYDFFRKSVSRFKNPADNNEGSYTRLQIFEVRPSLFNFHLFATSVVMFGQDAFAYVHPITHNRFRNIFCKMVSN